MGIFRTSGFPDPPLTQLEVFGQSCGHWGEIPNETSYVQASIHPDPTLHLKTVQYLPVWPPTIIPFPFLFSPWRSVVQSSATFCPFYTTKYLCVRARVSWPAMADLGARARHCSAGVAFCPLYSECRRPYHPFQVQQVTRWPAPFASTVEIV